MGVGSTHQRPSRRGLPTGVKFMIGLIVGGGMAAFILLTLLVDRGGVEDQSAAKETPTNDVGAVASDVAARRVEVTRALREGAWVDADGNAHWEPPLAIDGDEVVSPSLQEQLDSFVATAQHNVPILVDNDLTWLMEVGSLGRHLLFDYRVDVDVRNAEAYPFELFPMPITVYLRGWECEGGTCFDFTDALLERACSGEAGAVVRAGGVGIHTFRDQNHQFIGRMRYDAADCASIEG